MRCPNCGNENPQDYVFCDECGARLQDAGAAQTQEHEDGSAVSAPLPAMESTPLAAMESAPLPVPVVEGTADNAPLYSTGGTGDFQESATMSGSPGMYSESGQAQSQEQAQSQQYEEPTLPAVGSAEAHAMDESEGASYIPQTYNMSQTAQPDTQNSMSQSQSQAGIGSTAGATDFSNWDSSVGAPSTSSSQVYGMGDAGEAAQTPVTEDTMAPSADMDSQYGAMGDPDSGMAQAQAQEDQASLPGVMPIADEEEEAAAPMPIPMMGDYSDISPAASGAPAMFTPPEGETPGTMVATGTGGAWATTALQHLQSAQGALAGGDWAAFGQHMGSLKQYLESGAQGGTGMGAPLSATPSADAAASTTYSAPMLPGISDQAQPAYTGASSSGDMSGSTGSSMGTPAVEPGAEAGTLGAGMGMDTGVGNSAYPSTGADMRNDSPMPTPTPETAAWSGNGTAAATGAEATPITDAVARLVIISTGAEMTLPEQEEITVGREDPSSGIFPDVDLTPYGGEDGGVSRRHARILMAGGEYYVEDLQSTNYTKVDGQRLPAHVREKIEDGARLDFGRVAVIFRRS